mgnify:CR=1 FL=1
MAQGSFAAQVNDWVRETKERAVEVRNESAQRVIAVMQEPGPSKATVKMAVAAGVGLGKVKKNGERGVSRKAFGPIANPGGTGNLPVDTGFLRASLIVGRGPISAATTKPPEDEEGRSYSWNDSGLRLAIEGAPLTGTIEARYTAVYARVAEYGGPGRPGRRFVSLAAQQWQRIVSEVATEAQARAGG